MHIHIHKKYTYALSHTKSIWQVGICKVLETKTNLDLKESVWQESASTRWRLACLCRPKGSLWHRAASDVEIVSCFLVLQEIESKHIETCVQECRNFETVRTNLWLAKFRQHCTRNLWAKMQNAYAALPLASMPVIFLAQSSISLPQIHQTWCSVVPISQICAHASAPVRG